MKKIDASKLKIGEITPKEDQQKIDHLVKSVDEKIKKIKKIQR